MDVEGILAITLIFGGGTAFLLSISPIGRAIADRIRGRGGGESDQLRAVLESHDALIDEVEGLRAEFADMQERLDFTERLLTKGRDVPRLDDGADVHE